MRLFVQHADRTVVVALEDGATLTNLLDKCKAKFNLTTSLSLQLDVQGAPVIEDVCEVRDGDRLSVCIQTASPIDITDDGEDEHKSKKAKTTHSPSSTSLPMEAVMSRSMFEIDMLTTPADDVKLGRLLSSIIFPQGLLRSNYSDTKASNSLRLAERMIRKHNLEVMEKAEPGVLSEVNAGGFVRVNIHKTQTLDMKDDWFHNLARTMTHHFQCKYYIVAEECCFFFYGLALNAYAAAFAFETAFNRIMTLVEERTIDLEDFIRKRSSAKDSDRCEVLIKNVTRLSHCIKMSGMSYSDWLAMTMFKKVCLMTVKNEYDVTSEKEARLADRAKSVEDRVLCHLDELYCARHSS